MKILIADDSPTIIEVVRFLLETQGFEVVSASDGIEAIAKTYQVCPDLVLLDIEMPKMTGYQVCRLLKSDERTKSIPIIILTSRGQKKDRFWGMSTGADDFITKDFEAEEELFSKIRLAVERSKNEAGGREPRGIPKHQADETPPPITEVSVLEQVNHILDQQLFQATIVNELSYLAINMHSFFTSIQSIFSLLARICEFQVASIFLQEEKLYHNFLFLAPPVSRQFLQTIKQRVIEEYKAYQPLEHIEHVQVTILKDGDLAYQEHKPANDEHQVATFLAFPLKIRNSVIGILGIGTTKENAIPLETIDILHVFTNEASIVLDNALLFKQLEQSNLELEKTITQLKNTQAQLVQSEKMASLGQLVAGVAHEINTPAGAINAATSNMMAALASIEESFRQLMREPLPPDAQAMLLNIISEFIGSLEKERKSTVSLREDTRRYEQSLETSGLSNIRNIAKQMARFGLSEARNADLLQLLRAYNSERVLDFLEKCYKIVVASRDIKTSIHLITRIVNALKLYSRLDQAKVEEVDIHEGIETTMIILQSQFKYGIEVVKKFSDLPKIACYANELNQVWTNIIHNAIQAMKGQGMLTIETYLSPQDDESDEAISAEISPRLTPSAERKIAVRITDTGPGIPLEIQGKIFDPYFTTKDQGEGSGLGLGIAQQIVERHHGEIRLTSRPGQTSFEVLLPISGVRKEYLAS
ncbi:two-component sensor histidine kinase [Candidatus Moduliflexus flocculans]|uniref:histidine kinase n=1 Tax=Candidatus Moduliflexus flocculans TaxID=1499966 RepID=A0A0S6VVI3_9BACT|nr:two-component sensor histidine kinase [Candidatus Moduliflexus flocculans]